MDNKINLEQKKLKKVARRNQAELDGFKGQMSIEERKRIEKEIAEERDRLIPFYRRNFNLALRLRPKIIQLRKELGLPDTISKEEYQTWKQNNSSKIRSALDNLLQEYGIPLYQMPIMDWLFDADDKQIETLQAFLKNPAGEEPEIFRLLHGAMTQFSSPKARGWVEETGFRVAVRLIEEEGNHQFWGDLRGLPEGSWRYLMRKPGDFMVLGNLELFDIRSWRRTGEMLAGLKKQRGMGKKLGLLPGSGRGMIRTKKIVLRGMTWQQIREAIFENPDEEADLRSAYIKERKKQDIKEYRYFHGGEMPSGTYMRTIEEQAGKYFDLRVRKKL